MELPPFGLALIWCLMVAILHKIAARFCTPEYFPRLAMLSKKDRHALVGRTYDIPNAFVVAGGTALWLIPQLGWEFPALIPVKDGPMEKAQKYLLELLIGYLAYDSVADVQVNGFQWDMTLHHVICIGASLLVLYVDVWISGTWMVMLLLCEGSTPFLHAGWVMVKLELPPLYPKLMLANIICLALTYIPLRLVLPVWVMYHMYWVQTNQDFLWNAHYHICWFFFLLLTMFIPLQWLWAYKLAKVAMKPNASTLTEADPEREASKGEVGVTETSKLVTEAKTAGGTFAPADVV